MASKNFLLFRFSVLLNFVPGFMFQKKINQQHRAEDIRSSNIKSRPNGFQSHRPTGPTPDDGLSQLSSRRTRIYLNR